MFVSIAVSSELAAISHLDSPRLSPPIFDAILTLNVGLVPAKKADAAVGTLGEKQ